MEANLARRAADLLAAARINQQYLGGLPVEVAPATIDDAYQIQDATAMRFGGIGGWKLSPLRPDGEPTCSSIGAHHILASSAIVPLPSLRTVIEVEIAVKFAANLLEGERPFTLDEVRSAIGSVHLAIEVCGSRFTDPKALPPNFANADSQSNIAVIVGPARRDWQEIEFRDLAMTLYIDSNEVATTKGGPSTEGTLAALTWLANHAAKRCGGLRAGQVVITGARIPPTPLQTGSRVFAEAAGLGSVALEFNRTDSAGRGV